MEFTGTVAQVAKDWKSDKWQITFSVNEETALNEINDLAKCEKLSVEAKKYRKKRSLDANAYMWQLCNKIADKLRTGKDEIYIKMLKRYGQSEIISVLPQVDLAKFLKYFEEIGRGHVEGREFIHYKVFIGSSEYDTEQMSSLIDGIVSEAKELGIETLTPDELERMKQSWKAYSK